MRPVRRVAARTVSAVALSLTLAAPAFAQEALPSPAGAELRRAAATAIVPSSEQDVRLLSGIPQKEQRPGALLPLYAGLVTLQALDIHSTYSALSRSGAREANPVMAPVVGNKAAFTLVKASSTAGLLWATEKMWKKNRKAAIIFAAAANAGLAAVVSHNYRVAGRGK